jgi:imidazolonepropionase-like amidohydrolase
MSWWNEQRSAIVKSIGLVFAIIETTKKKVWVEQGKIHFIRQSN